MNIYCFSTLSFAKLQFKSVINKAFHKHGVASFTDAWIETGISINDFRNVKSHLLQMRGLKPQYGHQWKRCFVASFTDAWIETARQTAEQFVNFVASFTDAWIETGYTWKCWLHIMSHLLQMRGLKPSCATADTPVAMSHLLQMRGLKLFRGTLPIRCLVASFTDAWIETKDDRYVCPVNSVASFTDAWIETLFLAIS